MSICQHMLVNTSVYSTLKINRDSPDMQAGHTIGQT